MFTDSSTQNERQTYNDNAFDHKTRSESKHSLFGEGKEVEETTATNDEQKKTVDDQVIQRQNDTTVSSCAPTTSTSNNKSDRKQRVQIVNIAVVETFPREQCRRGKIAKKKTKAPGKSFDQVCPETTVRPGAVFVPWEPSDEPIRWPTTTTTPTPPQQLVEPQPAADPEMAQPVLNESKNDDLAMSDKQNRSKRCVFRLVVITVIVLLTAIGVGVAAGVLQKRHNETPGNTITIMEPPSGTCDYWFHSKQPNVVTQCTCVGSINVVASDVASNYDRLISQGFIRDLVVDFKGTIGSCDPTNQALVWLASGSGTPTLDANLRQRYTLALFYILWNGQTWKDNRGWLLPTDECTWAGVSCNTNKEVVRLSLASYNLNGNMGSEIGLLTTLASLSLSQNGLRGSLPKEIGNLSKLTSLDLDGNAFSGPLPAELGGLLELTDLQLSFNQMNGTIPTEFGRLQSLRSINLANNHLSGQLPTELGLWKTKVIRLELNNFVGSTIPSEIGLITNLQTLKLSQSGIQGTIPTEIFSLETVLSVFDVGFNSLVGTLPTEVGRAVNLGFWITGFNNMTGTLPTEFGHCTNLGQIDVRGNELTGTLPTELGLLTNLVLLQLDENQFNGSVPEEICGIVSPSSCIPTLHCTACACICAMHG